MKSIGRHIELIGCIQFNEITSLKFSIYYPKKQILACIANWQYPYKFSLICYTTWDYY